MTLVASILSLPSPPPSSSFFVSLGASSIEAFQLVERLCASHPSFLPIHQSLFSHLLHLPLSQFAAFLSDFLSNASSSFSSPLSSTLAAPSPSGVLPISFLERPLVATTRLSSLSDPSGSSSPSSAPLPPTVTCNVAQPRLSVRWRLFLGKCVDASPLVLSNEHSVRLGFPSSPMFLTVLPQSFVLIGSHSGQFVCADASTGNLVWQTILPGRIESSACFALLPPSSSSSPSVSLVAVGCYDGFLYVLNTVDGSVVRRFDCGGEVKSSPVFHPEQQAFWVGSHSGHLVCCSLASPVTSNLPFPTSLPSFSYPSPSQKPFFSSPVIHEGKIFAADLAGNVVAVTHTFPHSPTLSWSRSLGSPVFASIRPLAGSLLVATVDGSLHLLHPLTGVELSSLRVGGPIFSSPTISDSDAFFGCHDSNLHHLHLPLPPQQPRLLLSAPLPLGAPGYSSPTRLLLQSPILSDSSSPSPSIPVVAAFASNGRLLLLDAQSRTLLVQLQLPADVFSSPVATPQGLLLVGCRDDCLYGLAIE